MYYQRKTDKNGELMPPIDSNGRFKTTYTEDIAKIICDGITNGNSTRKMLREFNIDMSVWCDWVNKNPELRDMYHEAKLNCAEYYAEDVLIIADEKPQTFLNKDGNEQIDNAWVNNQKTRVQARQWAASMLNPKKYGNQSNVTVDVNVKLSERLDKILKDVTNDSNKMIENNVTDAIVNNSIETDTNVNERSE